MLFKLFFNLFLFFLVVTASFRAEADSASKRPPPPRRIPPNKVKPGGGLDFSLQSCDAGDRSLIALVPIDNPVLTTKAYPSFLFYVPDLPTAMSRGEFSILTADEKKRIYQTSISLDRAPGIIKIDVPAAPQHTLAKERLYHWYFKVYCQDSTLANKFLDVNGWIERVDLTPAIKAKLANSSPDIWYDAIANEADKIIANPQNLTQNDSWLKLMQHIDREHLTDLVPINSVSNTSKKETARNTKLE